MKNITVDLTRSEGTINIMHAVNNGPAITEAGGNHEWFAKAGIPYARNHDASFNWCYGGDHTVDISAVFPDFDADANEEASYDFAATDMYVASCHSAGTTMFYRLGTRIEHEPVKRHIYPPKDFQKWAVVCEHIIRHYTEGWANGFRYDMPYWEIWNEPDYLDHCWIGDAPTFYRLYHTAASHLKRCFPHLKIGGPAFTDNNLDTWIDGFLVHTVQHNTPLDFLSFHRYDRKPEKFAELIRDMRALVEKHAVRCELILNEWNYNTGWTAEDYRISTSRRRSIISAAFAAAVMSLGHRERVDMLMYYDARPSCWNGLFDDLNRPTKVYWSFYFFNKLYRMGSCVASSCEGSDLYTVAAADGRGKYSCLIARYNDAAGAPAEAVRIRLEGLQGANRISTYLLDENHCGELLRQDETFSEICCPVLKLEGNAVVYLEIEPV